MPFIIVATSRFVGVAGFASIQSFFIGSRFDGGEDALEHRFQISIATISFMIRA